MVIGNVTQRIRNVKRLQQILHIFAKYGFGYIVGRLNIDRNLVGRKIIKGILAKKLNVFDIPAPVRIRKMMEELGPAFIKLGQILSTRPDLIPLEFCQELEKLQNEVPAFAYEKVKEQIEKELKKPIDQLFQNFSVDSIAAASLSQVHLAESKSGEKLAVKVQRPDIEKTIRADLDILYMLAQLAEKHIEESRLYNPTAVVDEFKKTILKEINFSVEAKNIDRFRRNFKDDKTVYILKTIHQLSTKKILTMEKLDGIKADNVSEIEQIGLDRKQVAINGADAILKQIFMHGFFHADPHPGNIFVLKDGRIAFLDFGMAGHIDAGTKEQLADILAAVIHRDVEGIIEAFISMGAVEQDAHVKCLSVDLMGFVESYYEIPLKELRMDQFLPDLINIISQNRIKVPPDFFLLSKALITIEGVGKKISPDFNAVAQAKPFVERLVKERYSAKNIVREVKGFLKGLYILTNLLPRDLTIILNKIKKGTLHIEFEHRGLEDLISQMDKVSNRIAFSLVIAALIIGSSIVIQINKGPMFLDFPILGVIGFITAGIMGLWLAITILRSGKL
ncbi:MAG: phosphotransferase [Candidatus Omnitrophica bacterium]|nr:phosphotransferase [Candidatus Omnitrophota bacterium]